MNRDLSDVFFYWIVDDHEVLTGHGKPVGIRRLYTIVGTERRLADKMYEVEADKYTKYIRLGDIFGVERPLAVPSELHLKVYPWLKLIESVGKEGILLPVLHERYYSKGRWRYRTLEGKHRIHALAMVKPYNGDVLVPTILVERDNEYTNFMYYKRKYLGINENTLYEDGDNDNYFLKHPKGGKG